MEEATLNTCYKTNRNPPEGPLMRSEFSDCMCPKASIISPGTSACHGDLREVLGYTRALGKGSQFSSL
jgi:hypothetical protein